MMKIHLVGSEEEQYKAKMTRMNIALKFSKLENYVSVIIFKSVIEVGRDFTRIVNRMFFYL